MHALIWHLVHVYAGAAQPVRVNTICHSYIRSLTLAAIFFAQTSLPCAYTYPRAHTSTPGTHIYLCAGVEFTDMQRDALARSYLLDALDSSVDIVNRGIQKLEAAHSTHHLYDHVTKSKVGCDSFPLIHTFIQRPYLKWHGVVG